MVFDLGKHSPSQAIEIGSHQKLCEPICQQTVDSSTPNLEDSKLYPKGNPEKCVPFNGSLFAHSSSYHQSKIMTHFAISSSAFVFGREDAKQEESPYLSNTLMYLL